MEEFLRGINNSYQNGNEAGLVRSLTPGGGWLLEAPNVGDGQESALSQDPTDGDYIVWFPMDGTTIPTNTTQIDEFPFQVSCFSNSEEGSLTAIRLRDAVTQWLDDRTFILENTSENKAQRHYSMQRSGPGLFVKDPDEGYHYALTYTVQTETDD